MKNQSNYILYILIYIFCISCGIYSFNGASIDKKAETISISYFINSASTKQPTLSQVLTEKLKDYFTQQTNLIITEDDGHLNFKGEIIKYEIKPMAIQSNETAGQNRLTISVKLSLIIFTTVNMILIILFLDIEITKAHKIYQILRLF